MEGVWFFHFIVGGDDSGVKSKVSLCQIYGVGVPIPSVYVIITRLSAQQPTRRRPARANAIDQRRDQGKQEWVYLDDS